MVLYGCDSIQGRSHKITNTVCQDACLQSCLFGNWIVQCTADGVSMAANSDIGSKIAVGSSAKVIENGFPLDGNDAAILSLIRTSFNVALNDIYQRSIDEREDFDSYDTTLDVVIFNGCGKVYYGHCGDGGIYTLSSDGSYKEITTVQEGEESNSVKPLRCGNKEWEFGIEEGDIAVVGSFTDGIRDKLSPSALSNHTYKVKVPLADFFMRLDVCGCSENDSRNALSKKFDLIHEYFESPECNIDDDATVALIINSDIPIAKSLFYKPDKIEAIYTSVSNYYGHLSNDKKRKVMKIYLDSMNDCNEADRLDDDAIEEIIDRYYPIVLMDVDDHVESNVINTENLLEAVKCIKNLPVKRSSKKAHLTEMENADKKASRHFTKKFKRKKRKKNKPRKRRH